MARGLKTPAAKPGGPGQSLAGEENRLLKLSWREWGLTDELEADGGNGT